MQVLSSSCAACAIGLWAYAARATLLGDGRGPWNGCSWRGDPGCAVLT